MNTLARPLLAALSIGLATLLSGCFINAGPLESSGQGQPSGAAGAAGSTPAGGSAGSSPTGGSSGAQSSGGSAGSAGMTTMTYTCSTDCNDQNPCTDDNCDTATGMCVHAPTMVGTDVTNDSPTDCVKTVCDGMGGTKPSPDNTEKPPPDNAECHNLICLDGVSSPQPIKEGQPCAAQVVPPCQKDATCQSGECKVNNLADNTYNFGQCGSLKCMNGVASNVQLNDSACPDPTASECSGAYCAQNGTCGTYSWQDGTGCTKTSGFGGTCNGGHCCNGFGCD